MPGKVTNTAHHGTQPPITPTPRHKLTFRMVNSQVWMKHLPDDVSLGALSIPGTHNSGACYRTLPSVRCQNEAVSKQLVNGVRFLDLRVGKYPLKSGDNASELTVVHGVFPVRIPVARKFRKVLNEIRDFLDANPSECVILSLKVEGLGEWDEGNDEFPNLLWDNYILEDESRWYLEQSLPKLGEVRGKIVLFRRFHVENKRLVPRFGFDAEVWDFNTPEDDRGHFAVQDKCELRGKHEIGEKVELIKSMTQKAIEYNSKEEKAKLFINFTSGASILSKDCWPDRVANAIVKTDIASHFKKGCGLVIVDFADLKNWHLSKALVNSNFQK